MQSDNPALASATTRTAKERTPGRVEDVGRASEAEGRAKRGVGFVPSRDEPARRAMPEDHPTAIERA